MQITEDLKKRWNDIILNSDWTPNLENIYKELADFEMVIKHCETIYSVASGWLVSKCNTYPSEVISLFEKKFIDKDIAKDDMLLFIKDYWYKWKQLEKAIEEYFYIY